MELAESAEANTASGDVRLMLGPDNHAEVTLISNSRRVRSSLPLTDIVQDKKERQLEGTLGSDTNEIDLRSDSGSVKLGKL